MDLIRAKVRCPTNFSSSGSAVNSRVASWMARCKAPKPSAGSRTAHPHDAWETVVGEKTHGLGAQSKWCKIPANPAQDGGERFHSRGLDVAQEPQGEVYLAGAHPADAACRGRRSQFSLCACQFGLDPFRHGYGDEQSQMFDSKFKVQKRDLKVSRLLRAHCALRQRFTARCQE